MRYAKPLLFVLCLLPAVWLVYQGASGQLGPDAGKEMVLGFGEWGLRFLLLALAITPLRQWTGKALLLRYRRMLGLYAWFYASLHLVAVLTYLLGWSWLIFIEEFVERPYMALGIVAWVLMVPLGLSSNRWAQHKLGRRWKTLQSLVYVVAILACVHFVWLLRSDFGEALVYSLVLLCLLSVRVYSKYRRAVESSPIEVA